MSEILIGLVIAAGGSLINFLATKVYGLFTGRKRTFAWKEVKHELQSIPSNFQFEELKRRTRIVVIDDEDSFPLTLFKNEGYFIERWKKVTDYAKLESAYFDIIVLDIKGVAQHLSQDDGLGVLVNLKKKNPAQIIISYSQHSYDLSKIKFFELADENIAKPSDFLKIKAIIDNLISSQFKPSRYIDALNGLLRSHAVPDVEIAKVNEQIYSAIKKKSSPDWNGVFKYLHGKTDLIKQGMALGNTILRFFQ